MQNIVDATATFNRHVFLLKHEEFYLHYVIF